MGGAARRGGVHLSAPTPEPARRPRVVLGRGRSSEAVEVDAGNPAGVSLQDSDLAALMTERQNGCCWDAQSPTAPQLLRFCLPRQLVEAKRGRDQAHAEDA